MNDELKSAIRAVKENQYSFCKFISANDSGETGGHQGGMYIPKNSIKLLFDEPGQKGDNKEKMATIKWFDGTISDCRFIYYGKGSRNEYRITRLSKTFTVGDFVVIIKKSNEEYLGFVFFELKDIEAFLNEFDLLREDTNSLIALPQNDLFSESSHHVFRPRARIIKVIGQELISNDVIALVELIKNSYDADATNIEIEFNNIFKNDGEIIIKDNGLGMSYEKIINVWLEPATPDKKSASDKKYSKCAGRRLLGEKGIGRFAAHRLGDNITMTTRAILNCGELPLNYESIVKIDWTVFNEDKYLEEIPIKVRKNFSPVVFPKESGTIIKINNINPWKGIQSVRDAVLKIRSLESPIKPKNEKTHKISNKDSGISISITSNEILLNTELNQLKTLKDVLETAFYKFTAIISPNGNILYDYKFDRIGYQDIKREVFLKFDNLLGYDAKWFETHPLTVENSPGEFEVSFYAWDLDTSALKVAGLADYYKNIIKPNSGIRIYRDNFRVWPYGEQDNDWLELDLTRLNAPKERSVSRNQIFGIVHISSLENPLLIDQSNREGLIVNYEYEQFYRLVSSSLAVFAKERKTDKIKIDKVGKSQKITDEVSETISSLSQRIEANNHTTLYKPSIDKIQTAYHKRMEDLLERYMMAAAIGISYSLPIHEIKLRLTSIKHVIEDIERNAELEDKYLRELAKQVSETEDILRAVSSIMSKQKSQNVNLFVVANNVQILKEKELEKYNIDFSIMGDNKLEVTAVPGLLNTIVLNIVDNAIYWIRVKKNDSRQENYVFNPKIEIIIGVNSSDKTYLKVKDNGNGFDDPLDLLIEPYYSKKIDGFGLGLYLVNEIMTRFNGKLLGYNDNGAIFELIF